MYDLKVCKKRPLNVRKMRLLNVRKMRLLNVRKKRPLNVRKMRLLTKCFAPICWIANYSEDSVNHPSNNQGQVF